MPYSIKIDLHGFTAAGAKDMLAKRLQSLPKDTREVTVIHGYHGGTAIREAVRNFSHPSIERKFIGLNQGETIFMIKRK